jgi:hypothetical protein
LDGVSTLRTGAAQWLAQNKVKKDAEKVGNQNGHNRPKEGAHPAPFRVAVDIADQQQIAPCTNAGQ